VRLVIPDPLIFPVLKKAKKFRLKGKRQVSYLVQQKGAPFTGGYPAGVVTDGTGESALNVAEELALEQL
jgi:hypothetical protein